MDANTELDPTALAAVIDRAMSTTWIPADEIRPLILEEVDRYLAAAGIQMPPLSSEIGQLLASAMCSMYSQGLVVGYTYRDELV